MARAVACVWLSGWDRVHGNLSFVEPGSPEYTQIELDAELDPVITWTDNDRVHIATYEAYADGRIPPAQPQPRFVVCELEDGEYGSALELDSHGNPRVGHRIQGKTLPENRLPYISRP